MVMMAYKRNPDQRNIRLKVVELVPAEQWVEGVSNCGTVEEGYAKTSQQ